MSEVVVNTNVTLDGVMQAPGAPDEDLRGGFQYGGWALPYNDAVMGNEMGKGMGRAELLFGRRTYDRFYSFWPNQPEPNPFTDVLNKTQKYVVSTTLTVNVDVAVFGTRSEEVHVTVVVPSAKVEPGAGRHETLRLPSTASVAVGTA